MLTVELREFLVQLKEGAIHNVGAPNKRASVKLYDVADVEARAFGDERVKCVFEDDEGNTVEVALFPGEIEALTTDLAEIRAAGAVDGFGA